MNDKKIISIAERAGDSHMWSARQCLESLLDEIDAGTVNPDKLLILFWEDIGGGHLRRSERCVNFTTVEHVAFLAEAWHSAMEKWRDPK